MRERILNRVRAWNVQVDRTIAEDLCRAGRNIRGTLLDLGCGAKPYRRLFPNVTRYLGIDLPPARSANRREKSADVFAEIARIPFCDASVDAVLSTQVLEHVSSPELVIREAARVLRPGGALLLTVPFVAAEHEEPHDYFRFTRYGVRSLLERNGFEDVCVTKQFGFWSMVGEMIYWHFQRKVQGQWLERYWFAVGSTLVLRCFHLLNRLDPDEKLCLNLFVSARRVCAAVDSASLEETAFVSRSAA